MAEFGEHEFGEFGGQYVPEPLLEPLGELTGAFEEIVPTAEFQAEFRAVLEEYAGRPTPLFHAANLGEAYGADIYLKREDLLHGGAHKINNCVGQALLARKAGKERLIAETGAGQHGHGHGRSAVRPRHGDLHGEGGRRAPEDERLPDSADGCGGQRGDPWRCRPGRRRRRGPGGFRRQRADTHYLVGSVVGPDPFPRMVRAFQSVIGEEAREQFIDRIDDLPDACVACVGGGSNAMGLFDEFRDDPVAFYGGEGGGEGPESTSHAAPLSAGSEDVLHGMRTRVIGDDVDVHSVSAGLDYPGVGPEHAEFRADGRCEYRAITDEEALAAFRDLSELEGIIPALETAHAVALAGQLADEGDHDTILVNLSGRGDKDMQQAAELLSLD